MPHTAASTAPIADFSTSAAPVAVNGRGLTISAIAAVAAGARVALSAAPDVTRRIAASRALIQRAVAEETPVYGVNTLFGGMANHVVTREGTAELQRNLIWSHKTGAGELLPVADVRAAMLLRANSLMQGVSGVRLELIQRLEAFLNAGATPQVREFGSIGASGDLVPLACVAGAITGLDAAYLVDYQGETLAAPALLQRLGLAPLPLEAKEGLALINGTSAMTGMAANCVHRARSLAALSLAAHGLMLQALQATNQSFHPFIHEHKPHAGQMAAAEITLRLLDGSRLIHDDLDGRIEHRGGHLLQDRYSVRCLPQFVGPILDGLATIAAQVEVEANSVTDNPLIDAGRNAVYHCGNFLGQYIGVGMDQLRYYIGLLAKHLDTQIALLVAPEFNRGLSASLVGNTGREVNVGLKPLQLTGNSIMPMLGFFGNTIADRFPTHAEQFNQNINSMGYGSASLSRRALDIFEHYLAVSLLFAVQAVELRTHGVTGQFDARRTLSPATARVYEAVRHAVGRPITQERPLVWDDRDQFLDGYIARVRADIAAEGAVVAAAGGIRGELEALGTQ